MNSCWSDWSVAFGKASQGTHLPGWQPGIQLPALFILPGRQASCRPVGDLLLILGVCSVEEGPDFLHVDAAVTVLIDGVEYPPDEILDFALRKRSIAVSIYYGEHHSHPRAMHPAAAPSHLPISVGRAHPVVAL